MTIFNLKESLNAELITFKDKVRFEIQVHKDDEEKVKGLKVNDQIQCHLDCGGYAKFKVKSIVKNRDGSLNIAGKPQISFYVYQFLKGLDKIGNISVSEWADKYRFLAPESGNSVGRYKTSTTPYMREIMDSLTSDNGIEIVAFMKSAQIGGSEVGNNWLGYIIDVDPSPVILMTSSGVLAKSYSKSKIKPMLETTKRLFDKVFKGKLDNICRKSFKGGSIDIFGSNSASQMRSLTAAKLFLDEVDSYPLDVQKEGDVITLMLNRIQTAGDRKKAYLVSTPTDPVFSRIEKEFLKGDQRKYNIPCIHCRFKQELFFEQLRYRILPENPKLCDENSVTYECISCKKQIEPKYKQMLMQDEDAEWIPQNKNASPKHRSYHLNALYSPPKSKKWHEIVNEWLEAEGEEEKKKTFYNTTLGLPYRETHLRADPNEIFKTKGDVVYAEWTCPDDVIYVNAGVDTQDNYLAYSIVGYGSNEQVYIIKYGEIEGDTRYPEVYKKLKDTLKKPIEHASGIQLRVKEIAIDSGGHRQGAVFEFCGQNPDWANCIVGRSDGKYGWSLKPMKQYDQDKKGNKLQSSIVMQQVNTLYMKKNIYRYLQNPEFGFKRVYFNDELELEYFNMLCSEEYKITIGKNNFIKEEFVAIRKRNEALDCLVYSMAMARARQWENLNNPSEYEKIYNYNISTKVEMKNKTINNKIKENHNFKPRKIDVPNFESFI